MKVTNERIESTTKLPTLPNKQDSNNENIISKSYLSRKRVQTVIQFFNVKYLNK